MTGSTPSGNTIRVDFTPGATGGSPITSFAAQCASTDGGALRNTSGTGSPITVTGVTLGKTYHCRVRATNAAGTGPYSPYGSLVVVAAKPAAPTVTSSTPGPGRVAVAFSPGSDGGSTITGFSTQCRSTNGGVLRNTGGSSSPIAVTGLTSGKNYHCRVRATNAIGTGPYSAYGATVPVT